MNEEKVHDNHIDENDMLVHFGITEYTTDELIKDFRDAATYKAEQAKIFRVLDAADKSDIWKIYSRKLPPHTQLPVNNPITVIKEATKASLMPTSYVGDIRPMSGEAKEFADLLNRFLMRKWNKTDMDIRNSLAGDYAYLHGTGLVLFGWNQDVISGKDDDLVSFLFEKESLQSRAIHPQYFFPDPGASDTEELSYAIIAERKTKRFLKSIPRFAPFIDDIENERNDGTGTEENIKLDREKDYSKDIVLFKTIYKKVNEYERNEEGIPMPETVRTRVDLIFMAGNTVIGVTKDIQPSIIPIVALYDEKPDDNFWGISKAYKVLSLVLTLNKIDSIEGTHYLKNDNPPTLVNSASGLNIAEFQQKKENPDRVFTVSGDPRNVVHPVPSPEMPRGMHEYRQYLINSIKEVSGVDSIYQGSSFGSIQTTGGINEAIQRATLRDNVRVKNIQKLIKEEIEMILKFYMVHGKPEKIQSLDSHKVNDQYENTFDPTELLVREDVEIVVSESAPRTRQSYEEAALKLADLNFKYMPEQLGYPSIITPEELLNWLNIPSSQKQVLKDRMEIQWQNMKLEEYTAVVTSLGALTQGGMSEEEALMQITEQLQKGDIGKTPALKPGGDAQK